MSRTLIYTVQRVMEKLDLDPVNSLQDSPDAILVAREAEDTFYDLLSRDEWPDRHDTYKLESVGSIPNPTSLRLPDNVTKVTSVRYDVTESGSSNKTYKEMKELTPSTFLDYVYARQTSEDNVAVATYNNTDVFILNDKAPEYYTTFDNEYLVFDSYDSTLESTLQGNKSVITAVTVPVFVANDTFEIPLDNNMYSLYLSELTASCALALTGSNDLEAERRRNRGISKLRRSAYRTSNPDNRNYYGRDGNGRT